MGEGEEHQEVVVEVAEKEVEVGVLEEAEVVEKEAVEVAEKEVDDPGVEVEVAGDDDVGHDEY